MKKQTQIIIRLSTVEKDSWKVAAEKSGMSLSEFIRFLVNAEILRRSN